MQTNFKTIYYLLLYEVKNLINAKFYIYIMFLFFFNGVMFAIIIDEAITFLLNLIIVTFTIINSNENNSSHKKYLYIKLKSEGFFWYSFLLSQINNFILLIFFLPIFSIFLNLSLDKILTLGFLFVLCGISCGSILSIISITQMMSFVRYNFLISMLFPIMMPILLISNLILEDIKMIYYIILLCVTSVIFIGCYFISQILLRKAIN